MVKKYSKLIVYALCISLLVTFMISPVSAVDYASNIIDYFEYNDAPFSHVLHLDDTSVRFPLHRRMYVRYVDIVVTSQQTITGGTVTRGSKTYDMDVVNISSSTKRFYAEVGGGYGAWDDEIIFNFGITEDSTQLQVLSFKYSLTVTENFPDVGTLEIGTNSSDVQRATMSKSSSPVMLTFNPEPAPANWYADIYTDNWQKYDYIDFFINLAVPGISGITVDMDAKTAIPFTVSYIDNNGNFSQEIVEQVQDYYPGAAWYTFPNGTSSDWLMIHMDIRQFNKSSTETPTIRLTGPLGAYVWDASVSLLSVTGTLEISNQDSLSVWFSRVGDWFSELGSDIGDYFSELRSNLSTWFSNLTSDLSTWFTNLGKKIDTNFTNLTTKFTTWFSTLFSNLETHFTDLMDHLSDLLLPDESELDNTKDDMDQASNDMDQIGGAFDDIDTPDIDTGNIIDGATNFSPSGLAVLGVITGNGYVSAILVMVFTFSLVAYIFFGKR